MRKVGARAFGRNPFTAIELGEGLEEIGDSAFFHSTNNASDIEELRIPDSMTRMGPGAFCDCPLKKLTPGRGLKEIPREAFAWGGISLPQALKTIGDYAMVSTYNRYEVKEVSIALPRALERIGKGAFGETYFRNISLSSESRLMVDDEAFKGDWYLKSVFIGKGVVSIGRDCFAKRETYRNTKVDLRQAADLVHILPGAFAEAGRPDVALPQGRRWRAYRSPPGNWQGSGYATRVDDTSPGYIAEVRTQTGRNVRARRSGGGRRVVVF